MRLVPSAGAIYMDKLLELENQEKCLQLRANRNELQHQLQLKLEAKKKDIQLQREGKRLYQRKLALEQQVPVDAGPVGGGVPLWILLTWRVCGRSCCRRIEMWLGERSARTCGCQTRLSDGICSRQTPTSRPRGTSRSKLLSSLSSKRCCGIIPLRRAG